MTEPDILETLTRTLGDLLADDTIRLTMGTRRTDVPEWDSFAYINFIVAVEQEFGIKFGIAEVESFETVGSIVRRIEQLTS